MLDRPMPGVEEELPWKPFRYIFFLNLVVFVAVFGPIAELLLALSGPVSVDWFFITLALSLLPALLMACFATNLYRRSWNRRARSYRDEG